MTATPVPPIYLSEIFTLTISEPNLMGFRLTPEVEREVGNRLSFYFCRKFPELVVTWHEGLFWVLGTPTRQMPSPSEWKNTLKNIQQEVEDFSHCYWSFQWVRQPAPKPEVLAQLAFQILRTDRPFSVMPVVSDQNVEVKREAKFWAETIELDDKLQPAFTLTINSSILFTGTLSDFYQHHPFRQDPKTVLIGLKVQDIESGSSATIVQIAGTVGEHRQDLLKQATGSISKEALKPENAPDDQPLVAVQFGKNRKQFHYAMAALRPLITASTAERFGVDYGKLLKKTKISYSDRRKLLDEHKQKAVVVLESYGFKVADRCINSIEHTNLFWQPQTSLEKTELLFGKGFKGIQSKIIPGLKQGGVYRRHSEYLNPSRKIRLGALKLVEMKVSPFIKEVIKQLGNYGFQCEVVNQVAVSIPKQNSNDAHSEVEQSVNDLLIIPVDIVLVFLPKSDRNADNSEQGSFYHQIYSLLLNRQIASQFIYEDTLEVSYQYILNQIIPGILAKLGNIPFVLAEPLQIADYFIGLDIARASKKNLPGTLNACASVRLYGQRGEFLNYRLESELIEGEEIPQRLLEKLLPKATLGGKVVLIYRDGRFVNREVENFLARAKAINAKFILVECKKSGIPRLYNFQQKELTAPTKGLALRLSSHEAIVVTTKVAANLGLARPLRLKIHEDGHQASIETVVETTLKLTLLHHGALKTPRLPMPLYGADRMAKLRLNGIYPSILEGDRQFWL